MSAYTVILLPITTRAPMKATNSPYTLDAYTVTDTDGKLYTVEQGRIMAAVEAVPA